MSDKETLAVYDARAKDYAESFDINHDKDPSLLAFVEALPQAGRVLDLGCGPGGWSAAMLARGLEVEAIDASEGMVQQAATIPGLKVRQARFEDVSAQAAYDGIWANFSLLHAPKSDLPAHLARLHAALKPGGVLHIGLKHGEGSARDGIGRYYSYYTVPELTGLLSTLGMTTSDLREGADKGLDGTVARWFTLLAHKAD